MTFPITPETPVGQIVAAQPLLAKIFETYGIDYCCGGKLALVARTAIAALGLPCVPKIPKDDDLPVETQMASIRLRSGALIEGELRWTGPPGSQRTADFLNSDEQYIKVYAASTTYYVVKHHIAVVEER